MAHREQPYLPLYIQDYLTDEKLNECSASTQGIYIKIMCLMHKSDEYGKILLGQKYKQNTSKSHILLGQKLSKHLTFACDLLEQAVLELVKEGVCFIDNDGNLCQKRMIKDGKISIKRAVSGKKGGESTKKKFARANAENENESTNENEIKDKKEDKNKRSTEIKLIIECLNKLTGQSYKPTTRKTVDCINARFNEGFNSHDFVKVIQIKVQDWIDDPKQCKFLRPETLFGPKFEGYLQQITKQEKSIYELAGGGRNDS